MTKMVALLAMVLVCAGCLTAENRHAFYLEPDGAATWVVTEEDVRSSASEREEREREELAYLAAARRGETEIALALRRLGASRVDSELIRGERPYTVRSAARFESAASMLEEFLTAIGLEADTALRFEGDQTTLSFSFREVGPAGGDVGDGDSWAECLLEPVEQYRFVLTEGTFVEVRGFTLRSGDSVAIMLDPEELEAETEPSGVTYSLTWEIPREEPVQPWRESAARRFPQSSGG